MQAHPSSGESNRRALVVVGDDFQLAQGPGYASLHVSQRVQQRTDVLEEYNSCGGHTWVAPRVRNALDAVLQKRAELGTPHPRCVR